MGWADLLEERSSLGVAIDLVGDRWTLMIVTHCMAEYRRFNQLERHLGINRNLLKSRLDKLVEAGVLNKQPTKESSRHYEYIPTDMCYKLRPVIVGLAAWAEEYITKEDTPITYVHKYCSGEVHTEIYCEACEKNVDPLDVELRLNRGAGEQSIKYVSGQL